MLIRHLLLAALLLTSPLSAQVTISGMTLSGLDIIATTPVGVVDCDDVDGLHAWWDATAGITEDVGVTEWADQKNSYDWTQTVDASEPTLISSCQNSIACVDFDGTADYMSQSGAAEFFDFDNNDYTFIVVANAQDDANNDKFLTQDGTTTDRSWWIQSGGRQVGWAVSGNISISSTQVPINTTYISAMRWDESTGDFEIFHNACCTPETSTTKGGDTVEDGTVYLGTDFGATLFEDKQIMEVCVYLSDVSDADLSDLFDALNTKWSVY